MTTYRYLISVLLAFATAVPLAAAADQRGQGGHGWHGDIRHFERHDAHQWHSGGWQHGYHGGHLGWWWVAGGMWYFYPQPIYPYPDPYTPPVVVIQQTADPTVVVQTAPSVPPPSPSAPATVAPQQPQSWYYCEESRSYYPYVASCPGGWKSVAATPAGVKP